jgi:hypothetical protein
MMSIEIDWEKMLDTLPEQAPKRELIPADTYVAKVDSAKADVAKSGNGKIEMTFVVEEGQYKGRNFWGRINFATNSPQSMAITVEQLAQFGITRQWLAQNSPTNEQIARKLVGEVVSVRVGHREWEGETYYDVKGYKAVARQDATDPF